MRSRTLTTAALVIALVSALPEPARAQQGWGIGVLKTGDIFFCDTARERVWRLAPDGHLTAVLEDTHCRALVAGPDDAIYGESVASAVVATAELGVWTLKPGGVRGWLQLPSLVPDPGIWIVVDQQNRTYNWNGGLTRATVSQIIRHSAGGPGGPGDLPATSIVLAGGSRGHRDGPGEDAQFGHIGGLALAGDGSLVIADTGNIRRIDSAGRVRTEAVGVLTDTTGGSPARAGLWDCTMGVATDIDGSAVVVDYAARRVVRVGRDGRAVELWRAGGIANAITRGGWGWRPAGVAMLGSSYYVMEYLPLPALLADVIGSPRILHIEPGRTTTVVSVSSAIVRSAGALLVLTLYSWFHTARRRRAAARITPRQEPIAAP